MVFEIKKIPPNVGGIFFMTLSKYFQKQIE